MSDTLRIAYVLPGFCADEDDPCIPVITTFVKRMARRAQTVVYTAGYPHRPGSYDVHGITVHCTGKKSPSVVDKIMGLRQLVGRIEADRRDRPFDIVHGFWGTAPGYAATQAAQRIGCPSIVSLAGGEFADFKDEEYGSQLSRRGRWLLRRSLQSATAITSGSNWLAEKVPAAHRKKLRTIPLGIDTHHFSPGPIRTGRRLLAVAAMIPIKDYPTLLRGVALARRSLPDLSLSLVGWREDRSELERVERSIDELDLTKIVTIVGERHHSLMPELYRSHDLFLHSSRYEAQGMAILEGLATGMPVISTNVGIVPSLPENLVYRFEPGNWEQLGNLIVRSWSSQTHAEQAYAHGPELMRRKFDAERIAERFLDLYAQVREVG